MSLFKKKSKIPKGIKNISGFCYLTIIALIFVHWLVLSAPFENELLRPFQLIYKSAGLSPLSIFLSIIGLIGTVVVLVGFKKRGELFWKFTWIFFLFGTISVFIFNIAAYIKDSHLFNFLMFIAYVLLNGSFAGYIFKRKDYYIKPTLEEEFPEDKLERIFKRLLWVAVILLIVGMQGQKMVELYFMIKSTALLGNNRLHTETAISICNEQEGDLRDFCLVYLLDIHRNENVTITDEYCEQIKDTRYYDRCQLKFLNCNKVKGELAADICRNVVAEANK